MKNSCLFSLAKEAIEKAIEEGKTSATIACTNCNFNSVVGKVLKNLGMDFLQTNSFMYYADWTKNPSAAGEFLVTAVTSDIKITSAAEAYHIASTIEKIESLAFEVEKSILEAAYLGEFSALVDLGSSERIALFKEAIAPELEKVGYVIDSYYEWGKPTKVNIDFSKEI